MFVIRNAGLRRRLRWAVPFLLIPLAVVLGALLSPEKSYAFVTLIVAVLALLLFAAGFERKKTGTRRLVLVAVMTALSVAGRFFPLLKPVTALTVLTGMYLGGEAGFLTGALSAVVSNLYFGQGPWTPFQMLAWGLLGLFAGMLSAPMRRSRLLLVLYGVFAGVFYSFLMDLWTVLWYNGSFSPGLYTAALAAAAPYTALYAGSNAVFLFLFARPFGRKLDRVRIRYGV